MAKVLFDSVIIVKNLDGFSLQPQLVSDSRDIQALAIGDPLLLEYIFQNHPVGQ